ncbi:MAG: hypothetical protein EXS16_13210 [Gemmataceae bacterium]|nr:hypothetical protein [Gemmataceae bacterium]
MSAYWTPIFQNHFQRFFQKPFDVQTFHSTDNYALKVATYDWGLPGFRVYASLGLADLLACHDSDVIGEIILCVDRADAEVQRIFVHALFTILQHNVPLDSRFAIGFAGMSPAFARRHNRTALFVTRTLKLDSRFDKVEGDEAGARVFQAFFLAPQEDEFLANHSPHEFEQRFWPPFGEEMHDDELSALPESPEQQANWMQKTHEKKMHAMRSLSIRRPLCV